MHYNLVLQYTSRRCDTIAKNLLKIVKRITPKFRLNFCWRTIKTASICTPRLKESVPLPFKNGCIYHFTCVKPCGKNYIGESKRMLKTRISEHNQPSRKTAIYQHTSVCEHFQTDLTKKLARNPTSSPVELSGQKREHLMSFFKPIAFNNNYPLRTSIEALMIFLNEPELNIQVDHVETFLV